VEHQEEKFPNQHPDWPDKKHFETTVSSGLYNNLRRCQCWKTDRSAQCPNMAMNGQDICYMHGGAGVVANEEMQSRKDFQRVLAMFKRGDEDVQASLMRLVELDQLCREKNFQAIRYWLDQQFGGPATTIIYQVDPNVMEAIGKILADFIPEDRLDECLARIAEAAQSAVSH